MIVVIDVEDVRVWKWKFIARDEIEEPEKGKYLVRLR